MSVHPTDRIPKVKHTIGGGFFTDEAKANANMQGERATTVGHELQPGITGKGITNRRKGRRGRAR